MNQRIKQKLKDANMPYWVLADLLGKSESTINRMLRHELDPEEQERICKIIEGALNNGR